MNRAIKMVVILTPACLMFGCAERDVVPLEIGDVVPAFNLSTVGDPSRKVTRDDLRGKITVLNFWSTTCSVCLSETKELIRVHDSGKAVVVGIALEKDGDYLRRRVQDLGIRYPVVVGDDDLFSEFNGYAIPYTLILDRTGAIRKRVVGRIESDDLAKVIEEVDRKSLALGSVSGQRAVQ
jgi:cytochrome c biogenesis protein CcmG, thiol:disulfide interchange protein DsbE